MHARAAVMLAHVLSPAEGAGAWTISPELLVPLAVIVALYARGALASGGFRIARRRVASFAVGVMVLAAALTSPLHELGDQLFSVHMAQHLVLMMVAAPLLVYGRPVLAVLLALPPRARRAVHRVEHQPVVRSVINAAGHPITAWLVFLAVLWGWHMPALYQAAVRDERIHTLEHGMFMAAALLFWVVVIGAGTRRRVGYGAALAFVFTTMLHSVWLAMVLGFATAAVYPVYEVPALLWGTDPVTDQQLAGVVMWIPTAAVMVVTLAVLFLRFFRDLELRMRRLERSERAPAAGRGVHG